MQVRRYHINDFDQIQKWAEAWHTSYSKEQFPSVGFIVDGIAAYFLYQTDSEVCFLENLISNREVDQKIRHIAIEMIIDAILKEAKEHGFKVAYATTNIPSVIVRAIEHGAKADFKQTLLTKNLNDPT